MASMWGHHDVVNTLLEFRANVEVKTNVRKSTDVEIDNEYNYGTIYHNDVDDDCNK